ncbi:MAG: hypothetical protein ABIK31_03280 [candidate division WOR-3 bacterium]
MKIIKRKGDGYYSLILKFSWEDILNYGLEDCFSVNSLQRPTLILKGKFNNFINNYLVNQYIVNNRYSNVYATTMKYHIFGEDDNFVSVFIKLSSGADSTVKNFKDFISNVRENVDIDAKAGDKFVWNPNIYD